MAEKVTFVDQNDISQFVRVSLFGPEKNRVKVASVLSGLGSTAVLTDGNNLLEADEDGLSTDTFIAGASHNVTVRRSPLVQQSRSEVAEITDEQKLIWRQLGKFLADKERKASQKVMRISTVDTQAWEDIRMSQGFVVELWSQKIIPPKESSFPSFGWDDRLERAQADRYIPHLRNLNIPRKWMIIDAASNANMLTCKLNTFQFRGTTAVAVIDRNASHLPKIGLKVLLELKKTTINERAQYQTMTSLLLANMLSPSRRPIAMLTDLRDTWIMYWVDGQTIFNYRFEGRATATGFLEHFLHEEVTDGSPTLRPSGDGSSEGTRMTSITKRQKLMVSELEQLHDLDGFLPEEELLQDRLNVGFRLLSQIPVLQAFLSSDSSQLNHVYI